MSLEVVSPKLRWGDALQGGAADAEAPVVSTREVFSQNIPLCLQPVQNKKKKNLSILAL